MRLPRRSVLPAFLAVLLAAVPAAAPNTGTPSTDTGPRAFEAPAIGETDLFNLELVGNHDFRQDNGQDVDQLQGTDLEFYEAEGRDYAVVGERGGGFGIFDITDPENFFLTAYQTCAQPRNDVGIGQWTDATGTLRTVVALSRHGAPCQEVADKALTSGGDTGNGPGGFSLFDVTDPTDPEPIAAVQVGVNGAHNLVFHPSELIVYVWNGELVTDFSSIQIVDLRPWADSGDTDDIVPFVGPETLGSVHDGELSPDGSMLYVASGDNYEIFDNSDPLAPVRLGAYVPNIGTYAHGYFPTPDGTISITNNESLAIGGFFADNSAVCPGEGIAFYDTSDPANVIGPLSAYVPPVQGSILPTTGNDPRACTSHFGRVAPNGQVMTIGWYILGARVIDFSDPTLPVEVAAATISRGDDEMGDDRGTEAWAAKTHKGPYLYVGDQERGFDVFKWTPDCPAPWEDGWDRSCVAGTERLPIDPSDPSGPAQATAADPFSALGFDPRLSWQWSCRLDQLDGAPQA